MTSSRIAACTAARSQLARAIQLFYSYGPVLALLPICGGCMQWYVAYREMDRTDTSQPGVGQEFILKEALRQTSQGSRDYELARDAPSGRETTLDIVPAGTVLRVAQVEIEDSPNLLDRERQVNMWVVVAAGPHAGKIIKKN